tara:strand:+ start:1419 stop:1571 length:153 start_codon:yes stop_codon:yes gene_type:complete
MDKLAPLLFRLADVIMEDNSRFTDEEVQQLSSIFKSLGEYLDLEETHELH